MIVEEGTATDGLFAWVPDTADEINCNPGNENCGYALFTFSCATDSDVGFEYELRAPSGDDNQLGLQINDGSIYNWNIPVTNDPQGQCVANGGILNGDVCCLASCGSCGGGGCNLRTGGGDGCCVGAITRAEVSCADNNGMPPCILDDPWTWARFDGDNHNGLGVNTWPVSAGNHKLYIHSREDGVRLRNIRFGAGERGSCGFATELLLKNEQTAAFGVVTPPMVRDFVVGSLAHDNKFFLWTPDDGTLDSSLDHITADDNRCHSHGNCGSFEMGFSCSGPSKVKFDFNLIALDGHTDSLFVQIDEGEMMTWHIPHTSTPPAHLCTDMGGILHDNGIDCVPAECAANGVDYIHNCDAASQATGAAMMAAMTARFPGTLGQKFCCHQQTQMQGGNCMDDGAAPPCQFQDPWQWRSLHTVFDVDAGAHSIKVSTREDAR